ncbi:MAG: tRNA (adenosine(37)-N6)-threonylcarbamoyltransferase complex dimerization subunit type 1 TsaB [Oscillospiraceae bacterium]|nr:tRNA (adenosine(37)-N6)-threonylcarbamoyltransferase complex dimerization subunit type 1 TsaB [Oscillospiraceae bacterium]
MLILAFETSAKAGSVALWQSGKLLAESYQNTGLTHSQTLLSMAETMIKSCGLTPQDVQAVAVAAGPGSFTGVRIGVAAAKGFAWGLELPCCGVSTLEAMAENLGIYEGTVVCTMDARRSQVYNAIFRAENGKLSRLTPDRAISLADLEKELAEISGPLYLVGDGSNLTYQTLHSTLPALILPPEHRLHQRAAGVAAVAEKMLQNGEPCDAQSLQPNYLRLSQAERERLEKAQGV